MRTSIDIPDRLMKRIKRAAAQRKTTLRRLVLEALERSLQEKPEAFELRDASVGSGGHQVDSAAINRALDDERKGSFTR